MFHRERARSFHPAQALVAEVFDKMLMRAVGIRNGIAREQAPLLHEGVEGNVSGFATREITMTDNLGEYTLFAVELPHGNTSMQKATLPNRKTDIGSPHIALPLGPVRGKYYSGKPNETRYINYASDGGRNFGSPEVVDRFEGFEPSLGSQFSGGLVIENGNVTIVDGDQLKEATEQHLPAAQLFYSWTSENYQDLMNQKWGHFGVYEQIGESNYIWSWYLQTAEKVFFVAPKYKELKNNIFPIRYINDVNTLLSNDSPWKAALADSGLGGGFIINNGAETYSNNPHPENFHSVPLCLVAQPKESNVQNAPQDTSIALQETETTQNSSFIQAVDRYLRRSNTKLAEAITAISEKKGKEYMHSPEKRAVDLAVGIPATIVAAPLIAMFGLAQKIEDGGPIFYSQKRLDPTSKTEKDDGDSFDLKVIKLRSMKPHADVGINVLEFARGKNAWEDPRTTRVGVITRKFYIDELPQLLQTMLGTFSLIGIRAPAKYVVDYLKDVWSKEQFSQWAQAYHKGKPGLSGVNQIFGSQLKQDEKRFRTDLFYAKNASLGLDLYLLWRTFTKLTKLLP